MNSFVIEYVKLKLGREKITFDRMSWLWTKSPQNTLKLVTPKGSLIDGILIFNFGIDLTGTGVGIRLTDAQNPTEVIYENTNAHRQSIVAPFIYFLLGNSFTFNSTVTTIYGFNYITIRKEEEKK